MSEPMVLDRLLFGCDDMVAAWVLDRLANSQQRGFGACSAIGIVHPSRSELAGGVVYRDYFPHAEGGDVTVSASFLPEARIVPGMLGRLFAYPFVQLGCRRMTILCGKKNKDARSWAERAGFKLEGVRRQGFGRQDVMMYGLLKEECRFLSRVKS